MSKTILIKEDSLQTIKEKVVDNSNIINPNDVCVNEAAPEVDEYTIGGETDSPVGGRYYHTSDENSNMVTESKNSNRAHRQTRQIIAKYMGTDENDPTVAKVESEFEAKMFDEGKRTDWMIVLEPIAYNWYLESEDINLVKKYVNYIYLKATETTPPSAYIANVKKFGTFNEVKQFLDQQKKADNDASMEAQNNMEHNLNQNYEVRGPLNFDEAKAIGKKSCPGGEICYTQDEDVWDSEEYGNYDSKKCYVLLRNDWENTPAEHDGSEANNGLPTPLNQYNGYDSYGLSMIFVWIGKLGNLAVSNTRWNHNANYAPGHGVDLALKEIDIARLMGVPFEQVFGIKKVDINSYVKENLANSMVALDEIFDDVFEEYDNIQAIKLGNKYNYIVHEKHLDSSHSWYLLWDKPYEEWFDSCEDFSLNIGLTTVSLDGKSYFIDKSGKLHDIIKTIKGEIANDIPLDKIFEEVKGPSAIARVTLDWRKFNFINSNTKKLLWDKPYEEWFELAKPFEFGIKHTFVVLHRAENDVRVFSNDGILYGLVEGIEKRLKIENPVYIFDNVNDVTGYGNFIKVKLFGRYNFINRKTKELLWKGPFNDWFTYIDYFREGFARVKLNGKCNYINQEGRLLSDQWFDGAYDFCNGFAPVELNDKRNFINQEGIILSDQWFDNVLFFKEGFAAVRVNEKYNFINQEGSFISDQWFDDAHDSKNGFAVVALNGKWNYINQEGRFLSGQWFDDADDFYNGFAEVKLNGKNYRIDVNGNLTLRESKNKDKKILVSESQLKAIKENIESEVESSEVDLSSFKKKDSLVPSIWKDEDTLNSKVRLKLLDIADDFWEFVNITWVEPKGIILTGSICNFNWSKFSDIDLHLIVDFDEIDDRDDFVRDYMDAKKNEWNNEHKSLKIMDYPVELYVQNIDEMPEAGGIYDLEENKWLRKPNKDDIKPIGLNKFSIKDRAATIMTIIDDMWDVLNSTDDMYDIRQLGKDASKLWDKVKKMRKNSLSKNGEGGAGNIVYKVMRRMGYLDKIFDLRSAIYDKLNSVTEATKQYKKLITEEIVADGNAEHNPFEKRWKAERKALKDFLVNCGKIMTSKENGKQYKVYFDQSISDLIGYNYCICVQWNPIKMKPESTIYIRALDKFTNRIFHAQYDDRGKDNMRGTMDDTGYSQRFEAKRITKQMLTESQESKSIAAAKKLVMQRLGYDEQEADEFVRIKLRNDIPSLRTPQGGKFILGAARMFCDGELRNANDIGNLNSTLKLVASDAHINEYDRNLNGLSCQELVQRFAKAMSDNLEAEKAEINQMVFDTPSDYEIVRIDSFEQAEEYGDYVSWCVTHDEDMFDSYTCNGINQFYFCLKNGFENVDEQPGDACPLDEYGLSMIAVSVNENGMLNTCTCRWNHDNDGNDSIMNSKEVSKVIGMNFFEVFKPNNKWKELLANAKQRLANGEDIYDVFNVIKECKNGVTIIELENRYNLIKESEMQLISPTWFDWITSFDKDFDDLFIVNKNEKNNLINLEGQLIINQWVDSISNHLYNGFIKAELNGKYNLITAKGKFVSDQWFDYIGAFSLGFASVELNGKWNFIDDNGELLSNQWFESVRCFNEKDGFACVRLNGEENLIDTNGQFVLNHWFISVNSDNLGFYKVMDKPMGKIAYNFINAESQLLSDIWFDEIKTSFIDGFASVKLDGKWNLINTEGQLVSNQWFDYVECFYRDVCRVMLNNKVNYINTEGQPISDQWFDKMGQFYDWWVTKVQLNGKYNLIDTKGILISNQWFDEISTKNLRDRIVRVELNGKFNYLTYEGHLLSDMWFDWASDFSYGFARARLNGKYIGFDLDDIRQNFIDANGNLTLRESIGPRKTLITEANNKKRFKRQTLNVLAQGLGLDPNDPQLQSLESDFRNVYFGHLSNQEIDRVIGYEPLFAKCALDLGFPDNEYNDTEFTKYINYLILNTKDKENYTEIINHYKSNVSSFDDMRNVVGGEIKASKEANAEQQANMGSNINPNYQVLGPLTFDEAKRYGNRSGRAAGEDGRICYSQYEDTWLSQNYSNKNKNKCYILLRNDWQNLKGFEHDGSEANNGLGELSKYNAYDDYGLSMIMLFINPEGELHECNVRWNHGINGITKFGPGRSVDHALTEMDIANIMGIPFEQVFNVKKVDIIDNIKKRLANGEKPWDIFDYFSGMELGFGAVELDTTYGKKWNYLTEDGNLLWNKPLKEWFDSCSEWDYENEVGLFRIGGKYNFIKSDGTLLLGEEYPDTTNWPDYMTDFKDRVNFDIPVAIVKFGLYWAYLGLDGKLYDYRGSLEA